MSFVLPDLPPSVPPVVPPVARREQPGLRRPGPARDFARAALAGGVVVVAIGAGTGTGGALGVAVALALYGVAAAVATACLRRDFPHDRLGACNLVTLGRMILVAAIVAPVWGGAGPSWQIVALAALALALDGADGWLARRDRLVSDFGARFDMEVDAALALVLSVNAALWSDLGPVALLLGVPRYLFWAAGRAWPWLREPLPPRLSSKAVCVAQIAVLIALQVPLLPEAAALVLGLGAVAALAWSFGLDIRLLRRRSA